MTTLRSPVNTPELILTVPLDTSKPLKLPLKVPAFIVEVVPDISKALDDLLVNVPLFILSVELSDVNTHLLLVIKVALFIINLPPVALMPFSLD